MAEFRRTEEYVVNRQGPLGSPVLTGYTAPLLHAFKETYRSPTVKTAAHAMRKRSPHIYLPPTPMTAYVNEKRAGFGVYYRTSQAGYGCQEGTAVGFGGMIPIPFEYMGNKLAPDLESVAVTRALLALKAQDINYSQAFAERGQAIRLVSNSAKKVAGMYRALRHGDVVGAATALGVGLRGGLKKTIKQNTKAVGEAVLELNYGWKPLLQDNYGIVKDLMEETVKDPYACRYTVRGSHSDKFDKVVGGLVQSTGKTQFPHVVGTRSVRVRLDYHLDDANIAALASGGLLDPASLAWELTPWSFVADWFIPVGNYLQAYQAATGYRFTGGSCTSRSVGYGSSGESGLVKVPGTQTYRIYYASNGSYGQKHVNRRVYATSPLPRHPGFKNPLSGTHIANALALLRASVR